MPYLHYSADESETLGLKVARGEIMEFDAKALYDEIWRGMYDLCKVKINADNPRLMRQLENLGLPYHVFSIIYRNRLSIVVNDQAYVPHQHIGFELFEGKPEQIGVLQKLVKECIGNETGLVYQNELLSHLITPDAEKEASAVYACSFFREKDPNKIGWLITYKGKYVGYNLGAFRGPDFEGILIGVLPSYRNKGIASEVNTRFSKVFFPTNNIRYFINDIHIQNHASLKSVFKSGATPSKTFLHVVIFGLFSKTQQGKSITKIMEGAKPEFALMQSEQKLAQRDLGTAWMLTKRTQYGKETDKQSLKACKCTYKLFFTSKNKAFLISHLFNADDAHTPPIITSCSDYVKVP